MPKANSKCIGCEGAYDVCKGACIYVPNQDPDNEHVIIHSLTAPMFDIAFYDRNLLDSPTCRRNIILLQLSHYKKPEELHLIGTIKKAAKIFSERHRRKIISKHIRQVTKDYGVVMTMLSMNE